MAKKQINTRQEKWIVEWLKADAYYSRGGRIGEVYEEVFLDYIAKRRAMDLKGLDIDAQEYVRKGPGKDWPPAPDDAVAKGRPPGS